jgi:hypothetical protein
MSDVANPVVRESIPAKCGNLREIFSLQSLLRKAVALSGPSWVPLLLVFRATAAVAYADHRVSSISLAYLRAPFGRTTMWFVADC